MPAYSSHDVFVSELVSQRVVLFYYGERDSLHDERSMNKNLRLLSFLTESIVHIEKASNASFLGDDPTAAQLSAFKHLSESDGR